MSSVPHNYIRYVIDFYRAVVAAVDPPTGTKITKYGRRLVCILALARRNLFDAQLVEAQIGWAGRCGTSLEASSRGKIYK